MSDPILFRPHLVEKEKTEKVVILGIFCSNFLFSPQCHVIWKKSAKENRKVEKIWEKSQFSLDFGSQRASLVKKIGTQKLH